VLQDLGKSFQNAINRLMEVWKDEIYSIVVTFVLRQFAEEFYSGYSVNLPGRYQWPVDGLLDRAGFATSP